jgi:hypothetical protein
MKAIKVDSFSRIASIRRSSGVAITILGKSLGEITDTVFRLKTNAEKNEGESRVGRECSSNYLICH